VEIAKDRERSSCKDDEHMKTIESIENKQNAK
jgi:hypothetical protein